MKLSAAQPPKFQPPPPGMSARLPTPARLIALAQAHDLMTAED
jgi:hypothetical protein